MDKPKPTYTVETTDFRWTGNTLTVKRDRDDVFDMEVYEDGDIEFRHEVDEGCHGGTHEHGFFVRREHWQRLVAFAAREHSRKYGILMDGPPNDTTPTPLVIANVPVVATMEDGSTVRVEAGSYLPFGVKSFRGDS